MVMISIFQSALYVFFIIAFKLEGSDYVWLGGCPLNPMIASTFPSNQPPMTLLLNPQRSILFHLNLV